MMSKSDPTIRFMPFIIVRPYACITFHDYSHASSTATAAAITQIGENLYIAIDLNSCCHNKK